MRPRRRTIVRFANDDASGSLLGLAVTGSIMAALALVIPLYTGLVIRAKVAAAADTAALAAADVAAGIFPGSPCVIAAHIARLNGASLDTCAVDGLDE